MIVVLSNAITAITHDEADSRKRCGWGHKGPDEANARTRGKVSEALSCGEQAESRASKINRSGGRDRGVLGRLDAADPDAGKDEAEQQDGDARASYREQKVGKNERANARRKDAHRTDAIARVTSGKASQRRGDVVGEIEEQRDERRRFETTLRGQQFRCAEDQQRRGNVAELEQRDAHHQATEAPLENGPQVEPDRLVALASPDSEGAERRR